MASSAVSAYDFDLHGIVGIRLLDASPADVRVVARQLGPIQLPLARQPDILIRFVDRLDTARVTYLGVDDAGFTEDAFLVLRSKYKVRARVSIPLDAVGGRPEIVCERGLPAVPLLIPIVNLTALANGALPLHASAFVSSGIGVVTTGWSKGGKTEALLAFAAQGARYVGDEWIYVSPDGARVSGIPEPIRVWDWHLQGLPEYRSRIGSGARARLRALRVARSIGGAIPRSGTIQRVLPMVERQLYVDVKPDTLFGAPPWVGEAPFDRLVLVASHDDTRIDVRPIDPAEVADRMASSLAYERLDFTGFYLKFQFAFPGRSSGLVETAREIERERLLQVLTGKPAHLVAHPYPVSLTALRTAMAPLCR